MMRFGVFLMIASIIGFVGFMIAPIASADVRRAMEPYVCNAGETLEVSVSHYRPGETSYSLYCEGDGISHSTDGLLLGSMLVFFALLGVSIFFMVKGGTNAVRSQQINLQRNLEQMMSSGQARVVTFDAGDGTGRSSRRSVQINLSDPSHPVVTRDSGTVTEDGEDSLAGKLRQLQEAFEAGLLTQDEYDRKRRQIVDGF